MTATLRLAGPNRTVLFSGPTPAVVTLTPSPGVEFSRNRFAITLTASPIELSLSPFPVNITIGAGLGTGGGTAGGPGPAGPAGPAGPVGLTHVGPYDPARLYAPREAVSFNGSTWIAVNPVQGVPPPAATNIPSPDWNLVVAGFSSLSEISTGLYSEAFTVTPQTIADQFLTLVNTPADPSLVEVLPRNGITQFAGVDFAVVGNVVSWPGLALADLLEAGDLIRVRYTLPAL